MKCFESPSKCFKQDKYPKSTINKLFDKWLKKEYNIPTNYDYDEALTDVAIEYSIETPLSKEEKIKVLKDNGVI